MVTTKPLYCPVCKQPVSHNATGILRHTRRAEGGTAMKPLTEQCPGTTPGAKAC